MKVVNCVKKKIFMKKGIVPGKQRENVVSVEKFPSRTSQEIQIRLNLFVLCVVVG